VLRATRAEAAEARARRFPRVARHDDAAVDARQLLQERRGRDRVLDAAVAPADTTAKLHACRRPALGGREVVRHQPHVRVVERAAERAPGVHADHSYLAAIFRAAHHGARAIAQAHLIFWC